MTLKEKVENMDRLVLTGKFIDAVEQFFHPDAIVHSTHSDRKNGKATKIESLKTFFNGIKQINHIKLHSYAVGDDVTMSEFTFDFTSVYGSPVTWHEVIRRRWKDGLVYDEKYFTAEPTDVYTPVAQTEITIDNGGMTRISAKYESPVPPPPLYLLKPEDIVYTRAKKAVVMPDFAPQTAAALETTTEVTAVKLDDLKKIEGIGPKIEQILNDAGIHTFKQLASSNADHIKELLLNAGPRFRMHDPNTWMQQADLAAKEDWATLDTLQKALKGGRATK